MKFLQANRIAQDVTPRSAASYLGLFCLPIIMSHKRDARLKRANNVLTGFKLAKKFREKFCISPRKFGRSLYLNFRFAYIFYTFSFLSQLEIGRSLFI